MSEKNRRIEFQKEYPLLHDFFGKPELFVKAMGGVMREGLLTPQEVEQSPVLQKCYQRMQKMEAEEQTATQNETEAAQERIDQILTSLKALSIVFDGDKFEFIEMIQQLAFDSDVEFDILGPEVTHVFGGELTGNDEKDAVIFKNGAFAARCYHGKITGKVFLETFERANINGKSFWQSMERPEQ